MSIGSVLVGVALVLGIGAYLARPFRRGRVDPDRAIEASIEAWVSQVGVSREAVSYCSQCGHRVGPDDRFCAGCGRPLPGGEG